MNKNSEKFTIINKTKGRLPSLPFLLYKNKILGKTYELDLVFIGEKKIKILNKKYRNIDKPTDILAFPISKGAGEMFICQKWALKKSKEFERNYKNFLAFLFIHGAVHLLGFDHGNKMETEEKKYRAYFKI